MPRSFDLPVKTKDDLLRLSEYLPETKRRTFLRNTARQLGKLAREYPNTLVYAAVGWLLGTIVDHLLKFHIPFTDVVETLTGDYAGPIGFLLGALFGLKEDLQTNELRRRTAEIIGEELRRALKP